MFTLLFILSAIPIYLPAKKIYGREDLNVFDIMIVFSLIYFWAIPVQDFFINQLRPEYIGRTGTAIAIFIYMWILWFLACLYHKRKRYPMFLLTNTLRKIKDVKLKDSFQWFALIYILYMLFNITNYSGLDEDNLEGNNSFFYGSNLPFMLKIIAMSFKPFFPVLFIVIFSSKPKKKIYKYLRTLNLILLFATILLGEKTFMVFNCFFLLFYFYSVKKETITNKHLLIGAVTLPLIFTVFFPLSQAFRLYKQTMVQESNVHDFASVFTGFISKGYDKDLIEKAQKYKDGRSLNVYDALDWAASRTEYRGEGHLTTIVLSYIIPQKARNDGNIMGDKMMFKGADIGESVLAWYTLDWGVFLGPIIAILHNYLLIFCLYFFIGFFNKFFKSSIYPILIYSYILQTAVSIEHNPSGDIRSIYTSNLFVALFVGFILYYYKTKNIIKHVKPVATNKISS